MPQSQDHLSGIDELLEILPELPPQDRVRLNARINAVRERCNALVGKAARRHATLMRDAELMEDTRRSRLLRNRAHDVLQTAHGKAAVRLLDAQAAEYLPLTGARFRYQTLEVLAATAVKMYGGEDAVSLRLCEWRARWLDRKGAEEPRADPVAAHTEAAIVEGPNGKRRGRGRPQTIPDAAKSAALTAKSKGGSNKDAAKLIYGKQRPTSQQVKNVPSILKHFKKSLEKVGVE